MAEPVEMTYLCSAWACLVRKMRFSVALDIFVVSMERRADSYDLGNGSIRAKSGGGGGGERHCKRLRVTYMGAYKMLSRRALIESDRRGQTPIRLDRDCDRVGAVLSIRHITMARGSFSTPNPPQAPDSPRATESPAPAGPQGDLELELMGLANALYNLGTTVVNDLTKEKDKLGGKQVGMRV